MGSPQPTISPISHAAAWHKFDLNGMSSPGTVPRNGYRGFKRATGWDKKRGKGTQGATLTLTTAPPIEGEFALQLFSDQDFADWDTFVQKVLSIAPTKQQAQGLAFYYPGFSSLGLTAVVVEHYSSPEHQGRGMYIATIKLCEWQKPPPVSIVSTVKKNAPDANTTQAKFKQPPDIQQRLDQIALLTGANRPVSGP